MGSRDVFLTGATGFAGRHVVPELVRAGHRVTALVRSGESIDGCRTVQGDLGDLRRVEAEIERATAIVHLASPRSDERDMTLWFDVLGTRNLVDSWRVGPFIYASTTTIHGIPQSIIGPRTPLDPEGWYDHGKVVNELQVRSAAGADGRGPGILLRPTIYIGIGPRARDRQLFAELFDGCMAGNTFVFQTEAALETSGAAFVGLGDFARAVVAALGLTEGGAFPIAGGFVRWRDLIDLVNRLAGGRGQYVVRADGAQGNEVRLAHSRTELDSSAFVAAAGWSPQESIEALVAAFAAAEPAPTAV